MLLNISERTVTYLCKECQSCAF